MCSLKFQGDSNTGLISPSADAYLSLLEELARLTIDSNGSVTIPGNVTINRNINCNHN